MSYEGTRTAIEQVGFPVISGGDYRPWFYNSTAATMGHSDMVPQFRPQAALRMLDNVLQQRLFSPLLATDAELSKMNELQFFEYLNTWTTAAKAYV